MKRFKKIVIIFFVLHQSTFYSQNSNVLGLFPAIDHSGQLTKKLDYSLYYFAAVPVLNFTPEQVKMDPYINLFYLEQAINYRFNDYFIFTAAYVYQLENISDNVFSTENRFHIQVKYSHCFSNFKLTHRLRFDGRFVDKPTMVETAFTSRLRYQLGFYLPIKETVYFTAYEEAFLNTFKDANIVYGENWAYAGFGKTLNKKNKIELGILYITWNTGPKSWFNQYYLQLSWINQLNFSKSTNS
jgi:hypothetical protein